MSTQDNPSWMKSIALKIGSVLLIIIAFFFAKAMGLIGGSVAESYMESNNEDRVIQILADNIGDMRAQLPIVVDEITILEKVDLEGLNIIYEYKIELSDLNPSEISTFSFNLKNENTKMACNNPDLHEILEAGIKYHYNYYDLDNNRIPGFEVSKAICANFQYQAPR